MAHGFAHGSCRLAPKQINEIKINLAARSLAREGFCQRGGCERLSCRGNLSVPDSTALRLTVLIK